MKKQTFNKFSVRFSLLVLAAVSFEAYALKLKMPAGDAIHKDGSLAKASLERIQNRLGKDLDVSSLSANQQSVIAAFAESIKDQKALDDRIAAYLKDIAAVRNANAGIATWKPLTTASQIGGAAVTERGGGVPVGGSAAATLRLTRPGHKEAPSAERGGSEAPADSISPQVAAVAGSRAATKYVTDVDPAAAGVQISYRNVDGSEAKVSVSAASANKAAELTGNGLMAKVAEEMGTNLIPDSDTVHVGGGRLTALLAEQLEAATKAKKDINNPAVTKAAYKSAIEVYVLGKSADGKVLSLDAAAKQQVGPKLPGESDAEYAIRLAEKKAELEESMRHLCECSGQC